MNKRLFSVIACLVLSGAMLSAADKSEDGAKKSPPAATRPAPVNKICPVDRNNPVDPLVPTVTYNGQVIGFCCEECIGRFNRHPEMFVKDMQ